MMDMEQFKISNMSFNYTATPMQVNISFDANFSSGNTLSGRVSVAMDEFNAVTDGLLGYSKLVKSKIAIDFEALEPEKISDN